MLIAWPVYVVSYLVGHNTRGRTVLCKRAKLFAQSPEHFPRRDVELRVDVPHRRRVHVPARIRARVVRQAGRRRRAACGPFVRDVKHGLVLVPRECEHLPRRL